MLRAVDADLVKDATRFKMDLTASLERTLHGKVKPSECIMHECAKELSCLTAATSDHTMLYAAPVRPAERAGNVGCNSGCKGFRKTTMRSPSRRLPGATQHYGVPHVRSRPEEEWHKHASLCRGDARAGRQENNAYDQGCSSDIYRAERHDHGADVFRGS